MRFAAFLLLIMTGTTASLPADQSAILNRVQTDQKVVALTFDDGPDAPTLEIMDLIEAAGGRATFFVVGNKLQENAEVLRRTARTGHEIGNHSFTHSRLPDLGPEEIRKEVSDTQALVLELTGHAPVLFRAPFLSYNEDLHGVLAEAGLLAVNADKSAMDWDPKTTKEQIIQRVTGDLSPGSIVLMHSWPEKTLAALPEIMRILQEEGYRMVTVSEMLKLAQ